MDSDYAPVLDDEPAESDRDERLRLDKEKNATYCAPTPARKRIFGCGMSSSWACLPVSSTPVCLIVALAFVASLLGSFTGTAYYSAAHSNSIRPVGVGVCGNTTQEAQENGCIYDVLQIAYVHVQCFDEDLHSRYLREHNLTFYGNKVHFFLFFFPSTVRFA